MIPEIQMEHGLHKNKVRLFLKFPYNSKVIDVVKSIPRAKWSHTKKVWHVPYDETMPKRVRDVLGKMDVKLVYLNEHSELPKPIRLNQNKPIDELAELNLTAQEKAKAFMLWMRSKRYSESTIDTYTDALKTFLRFYSSKAVSEINNADVIRFNNEYILKNKFSSSYQNQVVNAIKLFFRTVEHKTLEIESIHRPKRAHVLPNVLSKEEIKLILSAHQNIKHKAMLSLIYSCGLRRSELLNLKLSDIDSKRGLILVKQAKGKKDRVVPLSDKILVLLRDYFMACKPKEWLFEGQNGSKKYDENSLSAVLKQALEKSGINKPVTLHWLRHSYATHLLENGTDLRYIQEILGHSRSTTTEIYTHVSNKSIQKVISPFDSL